MLKCIANCVATVVNLMWDLYEIVNKKIPCAFI